MSSLGAPVRENPVRFVAEPFELGLLWSSLRFSGKASYASPLKMKWLTAARSGSLFSVAGASFVFTHYEGKQALWRLDLAG
jgi:hypothetical protein